MRPLTIVEAASAVVGLQQEIQRSEESRYDHRLHGVLLVAQGMTCPGVARLLVLLGHKIARPIRCQKLAYPEEV